MGWRSRGNRKVTYHSVGWIIREAKSAVFQRSLCPAGILRVMDKGLHTAALENAGRKLKELRHKSGTREPGHEQRSGPIAGSASAPA